MGNKEGRSKNRGVTVLRKEDKNVWIPILKKAGVGSHRFAMMFVPQDKEQFNWLMRIF